MTEGRFAYALLEWFRANGRQLPWRETRDAYAIWLSEIILQQTRIDQGLPYWERFMLRWPTVESLAAASEDEVLRMWQGLGYYSRARNLLTAARQVVEMGGFPRSFEGLRLLKGVGDYTAAAVGSIAFDLPVAVVDGNVYRVLSRHFGLSTPINSTEGRRMFAELAQKLLPPKEASAYNQALMDFGALQCTPQSPDCSACPLAESCLALAEGMVASLPVKLKTVNVQTRRMCYVYVRWQGQTAFRRRPGGDIWQGLWEPLLAEGSVPEGARLLRKDVRHVLTHRILLADFYVWEPASKPALPEAYRWIAEEDLCQFALPRLVELLVNSYLSEKER